MRVAAAAVQRARPPQARATPPPDAFPPNALAIYTDGSGPERDATDPIAGWGFAVVSGGDGKDDEEAVETHSRCGRVITNAQQAGYIGAQRATNNTAELTAIARALEYIIEDKSGRPAVIRYDSMYAGNIATGTWRARANRALAQRIRALWTRAHDHLQGQLWASHVYGHNGHKWNERADELARRGARASNEGAPQHNDALASDGSDENDNG